MAVKLLQYWNIKPDVHDGFAEFLSGKFIPFLDRGENLQIVGTWDVASGEGPRFIAEVMAQSVEKVEEVIMSPEFWGLKRELLSLVTGYNSKLLVPTGRVEPRPIARQTGCKFNQHFNIRPEEHYAFVDFVKKSHIAGMEKLGIEMVGGWYVAVGDTPYVIAEGQAPDLAAVGRLLEDPAYQKLTLQLMGMVTSYGCKVLVPSGHLNP